MNAFENFPSIQKRTREGFRVRTESSPEIHSKKEKTQDSFVPFSLSGSLAENYRKTELPYIASQSKVYDSQSIGGLKYNPRRKISEA